MLNKFTLILSFIIILFVHFTVLSTYKVEERKVVVAQQTSVSKISVRKVTLKKKLIEKKEVKKIVKKPIIKKVVKKFKKVKKIVKKAKRKIPKRVVKKVIKKPKKEIKVEKVVKRMTPKIIPSITKKIMPIITKKVIISNATKDIIKNEYLSKLRAKIEQNKTYPKRAKRLKQQGQVVIAFKISKSGHIENVNLKGSCPYKRLNEAAIKLLIEIAKFEPIPSELEKNSWAIEVPINYSIVNI